MIAEDGDEVAGVTIGVERRLPEFGRTVWTIVGNSAIGAPRDPPVAGRLLLTAIALGLAVASAVYLLVGHT